MNISAIKIREAVEEETGLDISSRKRNISYTHSRFIYFKICKELTKLSLEEIGKEVGRDHATVLHGIRKFEDDIKKSKHWYRTYLLVKSEFTFLKKIDKIYLNAHKEILESYKILQAKTEKANIQVNHLKKIINDYELLTLLVKINPEDLSVFKETKLIPFLKMRNAL